MKLCDFLWLRAIIVYLFIWEDWLLLFFKLLHLIWIQIFLYLNIYLLCQKKSFEVKFFTYHRQLLLTYRELPICCHVCSQGTWRGVLVCFIWLYDDGYFLQHLRFQRNRATWILENVLEILNYDCTILEISMIQNRKKNEVANGPS